MDTFLPRTREEFTLWALQLKGLEQEDIDRHLIDAFCDAEWLPGTSTFHDWIISTCHEFPDLVCTRVYQTKRIVHAHVTVAGVLVEILDLDSQREAEVFEQL